MRNLKKLAFWLLLDVFKVYHNHNKEAQLYQRHVSVLTKAINVCKFFPTFVPRLWKTGGNFQRNILCSYFGNFSDAINEPKKFCSFDNVCI